ncbi:MAG: glycosyltransferase family 9 protein [Candidatus Eisenbacteria sp.]|nr:glycosyltransferase family 9 protein [Candidatus Eisenbacteria bacterium]
MEKPGSDERDGIRLPIVPERILMIRLRALGDVLLTTPAVRAMRRAYPDAYLAMMVRKNMAGAMEGNPNLDEVIICDPWYGEGWPWTRELLEFIRVVRGLRRRRFDLVIDLFGNPRSAWLAWLSGAPYRLGYNVRGRRLAYNLRKERFLQRGERRREVDVHLDMVRVLGIEVGDKRVEIQIGDLHRRAIREFLAGLGIGDEDRIVSLSPSAKWQAKQWKPESYARLARMLREAGWRVIILWGPGENLLAEQISEAAGDGVFIGPRANLKELAAMVEISSMLIGTDSGVTHVAEAVGTPSIVLYGPTDPRVWHSDDTERHVALYLDGLDCLFCNRKFCETHECMDNLTPERVMEEVQKLR